MYLTDAELLNDEKKMFGDVSANLFLTIDMYVFFFFFNFKAKRILIHWILKCIFPEYSSI